MATYFKAVRPDGGSFNDPSFRWAVELGGVTTHPLRGKGVRKHADGAAGYLSVSVAAADCTGFRWPCRLLVVEPVGRVWTPDAVRLPSKRAGLCWRTVGERPAHEALGPQGVQVAALLARCGALAPVEATGRDAERATGRAAVWDAERAAERAAARAVAWDAERAAAREAAREAAVAAARAPVGATGRAAVWDAVRAAARGLVVRDLIATAHYDTLTGPWRTTIGPIHPDDPDWKEA